MSWRERVTVQLLLLVARIVYGNAEFAREIKNLSTHISVHGAKELERLRDLDPGPEEGS